MSPQRPSGRRFAAFLAALAVAASAFGALVLPLLADDGVPAPLQAKPSLSQQRLDDARCPHDGHGQLSRTEIAGT